MIGEAGEPRYVREDLAEFEHMAGWPEAGATAALVVAFALDLVAAVTRAAGDSWDEAGGALAQAEALRGRAVRLGRENAGAYARARGALASIGDESPDERAASPPLGDLLERAAEAPLGICEAAADAADLAALAAERIKPEDRADAAGAAMVATGAARAAAHLVEINLSMRPDDERIARARGLVELAEGAGERALAASS